MPPRDDVICSSPEHCPYAETIRELHQVITALNGTVTDLRLEVTRLGTQIGEMRRTAESDTASKRWIVQVILPVALFIAGLIVSHMVWK